MGLVQIEYIVNMSWMGGLMLGPHMKGFGLWCSDVSLFEKVIVFGDYLVYFVHFLYEMQLVHDFQQIFK